MHVQLKPHLLASLDGHIVLNRFYMGAETPYRISVYHGGEDGISIYTGSLEDCAAHLFALTSIMQGRNGSTPMITMEYWHKRTEAIRRDVASARSIQTIIKSVKETE